MVLVPPHAKEETPAASLQKFLVSKRLQDPVFQVSSDGTNWQKYCAFRLGGGRAAGDPEVLHAAACDGLRKQQSRSSALKTQACTVQRSVVLRLEEEVKGIGDSIKYKVRAQRVRIQHGLPYWSQLDVLPSTSPGVVLFAVLLLYAPLKLSY